MFGAARATGAPYVKIKRRRDSVLRFNGCGDEFHSTASGLGRGRGYGTRTEHPRASLRHQRFTFSRHVFVLLVLLFLGFGFFASACASLLLILPFFFLRIYQNLSYQVYAPCSALNCRDEGGI